MNRHLAISTDWKAEFYRLLRTLPDLVGLEESRKQTLSILLISANYVSRRRDSLLPVCFMVTIFGVSFIERGRSGGRVESITVP
jgi:hypothetical protein